ncbi:hypothetical protein, partial [Halococcus sp. AFM35]|uniref:hypothetical protein n=1 Tax=Halococcus sp. AFM35 TaxID=3421653 RepID=UPI003EB88C81
VHWLLGSVASTDQAARSSNPLCEVLIFNLIGGQEDGEKGISDCAGAISQDCGILADENLREMGEDASKRMDNLKEPLFDDCESLIDEIMKLRNEDLQADFKE